MNNQRIKIKQALEVLVEAQRHRDFQRVAVHLAKRLWPELQATEEQNDGGEDATSFVAGTDGLRRSLAVSLTGTLTKIKADAGRIKGRGIQLDCLIFITPVAIDNLTAADWSEAVKKEFGHGVQIIPQTELITLLEQPENRWLCKEYLGLELETDKVLTQLAEAARRAAGQILSGWKAANHFEQAKTIELTLLELPAESLRKTRTEARRVSVKDVFDLVVQRRSAIVFGEPGAGKTFTLIQLADALLQDPLAPIPVLLPLPVWASSGKEFFAFMQTQFLGHQLQPDDLAKLCANGQVALLLNGWNEISDASVERTSSELKALILQNPALPIIISTRNSQVSPPLATASDIHVAALSHEQKLAIVKKSGLGDPSAFATELETNDALAAITDTPLFLSASITIARAGESLPHNRYGILERFVEHCERSPDHSAGLKGPPCNSFHRRYLQRTAVKMTQLGGTTLSFDEATAVVAECSRTLQREGHFEAAPNSAEVLDCLVRHHLLVLSPIPGTSYRFVHHQFQEWFAAESLNRSLAVLANNQNTDELFAFQRDVLNHVHWQEPLFFLMERLAGSSEGDVLLSAKVVRWAMEVDLLLACELAGAAGANVWAQVGEELGNALRKWYQQRGAHHRHCALAAMLATGAPDFQDILWPLLESGDQNVRLLTYRTWRAFPLSCLGTEWRSKFSKWNAERKVEFIREFSWGPTREHFAFVSELVKGQENPEVKLACYELLLDAGAYETLIALSADTSVADWPYGFVERIIARLPNRYLEPFIAKVKSAFPRIESFSVRRAITLTLQRINDSDWPGLVKGEMERLLRSQELDFRPPHQHLNPSVPTLKPNGSCYLAEYLQAINQKEPEWAANWLANLLAQGRFWWEPFTDFITKMPERELRSVAATAVDPGLDVNTTRQRVVGLATSGSLLSARIVLHAYLAYEAAKEKMQQQPHFDRGDALEAGLKEFSVNVLVDAVLAEAQESTDFETNRRLIKLVRQASVSQASEERKDSIRALVFRLECEKPKDVDDKGWFRSELVDVLGRVAKPIDSETIEKWIQEDVERLTDEGTKQQAEFQQWETGGRKGRPPVRTIPCAFWNSYQRALIQLGGQDSSDVFIRLLQSPTLLNFAAAGLYLLTCERNETADSPFGDRPDYVGVHARQQEQMRADSRNAVTKRHADAIFAAVERFLPELEKEGSKFPKNEILGAVASLAALNDARALPLLGKFTSDKYAQWTVTNALHNLMLKGTVLPGDTVATMLEPLISENEKAQWGSNSDNWHMVVRALAVLLFSDSPKLAIERIRRLPDFRLKNHYVRDLLVVLGSCRVPEAIDLIVELAVKPEVNESYLYEVATVLSQSPNPDSERGLVTLLEKLCSGELNSANAHSHLPRAIAQAAKRRSGLWDEIKRRCTKPQSPRERHILLHILSEVENYEAAICLCDLMNDEFPMGYPAEHLIEQAVTRRVPAGGSSYYVRPREATELKRRLIEIAYTDVKRRTSALQLLGVIVQCRLEHGWPADEPLHPDIELLKQSGAPWPLM